MSLRMLGGSPAPTNLEFRVNDMHSIGTGIWAPKALANARLEAWSFTADADIQVAINFAPPAGWTAANIDIHWYGANTAAGNVIWRMDVATLENAEGSTTIPGTGSRAVVSVAPVTANLRRITTLGLTATVVAGRDLYCRIVRVGLDANDTYPNAAHLMKVVARRA